MSTVTRIAATAAVSILVVVGGGAAAWSATPGIGDVSDAMRYDAAGPYGTPLADLSGQDDEVTTVAAPFPINFFGVRSEGVCVTTNGGFYPVSLATDGCNNNYDENLENLALSSSASIIAALAADLDLGECAVDTPDAWGVPCEIYFGTTTIGGRDAFVITWYRVPMFSGDNDPTLSSTFQIVILKRATGDDTVGWDFDIEFNFGTLTDVEDGYSAADPSGSCDMDDDPTDCRWGVGWASYDVDTDTAEAYELFATTPTADLADGGVLPLVMNSLNSTVLGRYTFAMVGGVTTGFEVPVLVEDGGAAPAAAPELADTGAANTNIAWLALALVLAGTGVLAAGRRLGQN